MKNYELFEVAQRLGTVLPSLEKLKGPKFHYALLKNLDLLQKEIDLIQSKSKPSDKFLEYEKARVALCEAYCAKDDKGENLKREIGNGQFEYDIDTTSEEWKTAIEKLKSENAELINERDHQVEMFNQMLDVESSVKFHTIKIDDLPSEVNGEQMQALKHFIQE